jgi:hypothetical protein
MSIVSICELHAGISCDINKRTRAKLDKNDFLRGTQTRCAMITRPQELLKSFTENQKGLLSLSTFRYVSAHPRLHILVALRAIYPFSFWEVMKTTCRG